MSDYIDREELIKHIKDLPTWWADGSALCAYYLTKAITSIEEAPAADVQEIKHGEWIKYRPENALDGAYFCSICFKEQKIADGMITPLDRGYHYCPNCGAKMEKGESLRQ